MNTRTVKRYYATQRRNRALLLAVGGHIIAIIAIAIWLLKPLVEQEKDSFVVNFVSPTQQIHRLKKPVSSSEQNSTETLTSTENTLTQRSVVNIRPVSQTKTRTREEPPIDSTVVDLPDSDETTLKHDSPDIEKGSGKTEDSHTGKMIDGQDNGSSSGLIDFSEGKGTGQDPFDGSNIDNVGEGGNGDEPFITFDEEDGIVQGHIRLIRLKHDMSDWWQDPTAIPSLIKWLKENVKAITADMKFAGGALPLTDKDIMDVPLVIMTGHDQAMSVSYQQLADRNSQTSRFSDAERAALRKYILDYNGMLFFDYCGNGGNEKSFATLVENELRTVFPEYPIETLRIQHEIFKCYFKLERTPVGGSWFWGTNYKGGNNKWRYIKGISVPGRFGKDRLAVVFCPLDYLCSMETEAIDSRAPLSARRSSDVYRFMTNMFVYQMRQRTDNN